MCRYVWTSLEREARGPGHSSSVIGFTFRMVIVHFFFSMADFVSTNLNIIANSTIFSL